GSGGGGTPARAGDPVRRVADLRGLGARNGVPDYTPGAMTAKAAALKNWQARLARLDRTGWTIEAKVDAALIGAEMNGLDFDLRVLKPWQRDPAFYVSLWPAQSDTPAHEGPIHNAPTE